ncbi:hypothetical protein ERO13_A10G172200v2 [Gossypium hirsutum]|uniref:SAM domain-containing protein n=1 Tax=Gossypium barbadense TaxID=3634 RepID=A0A5J5U5V1_GOSBA|nr:hypothetical protein ES319_A10G185100v1 [Gossypium barbadense]KAB2062964.1 hypothetical protein ES319_A10G185100v1 [Gossypium barbadense]KAG4180556.1 hypothetical protein ERO13_A10G172200v2 [Gossypium hirsutum]
MLIQCPKNSILPSSLSHLKNVLTQLNNHSQSQPPLLHSLPATSTPPLHRNILQVDMTALKQMGENDLKELGIPMGPREKILLALLPVTAHFL